jgi:arsenate reductase
MKLTIYHNPRCSKSRRTLDLIREHGIEPEIVHYLDETPDAATLLELARLLGTGIGPMMRNGESEYREAKDIPTGDDRALAEWLSRHPRVLQRPLVVDRSRGRAVIGRPPENVLGLLDPPSAGPSKR